MRGGVGRREEGGEGGREEGGEGRREEGGEGRREEGGVGRREEGGEGRREEGGVEGEMRERILYNSERLASYHNYAVSYNKPPVAQTCLSAALSVST